MGRAARNVDSKVLMYADVITKSMEQAIKEVVRRRKIQIEYNKKHGITPKTIEKAIRAKLVEKEEKEQEQSIDFLLQMSKKEVLLPEWYISTSILESNFFQCSCCA